MRLIDLYNLPKNVITFVKQIHHYSKDPQFRFKKGDFVFDTKIPNYISFFHIIDIIIEEREFHDTYRKFVFIKIEYIADYSISNSIIKKPSLPSVVPVDSYYHGYEPVINKKDLIICKDLLNKYNKLKVFQ